MHSDFFLLRMIKKIKTADDDEALLLVKQLQKPFTKNSPMHSDMRLQLEKPGGEWEMVWLRDICYAIGAGATTHIYVWRHEQRELFYFGANIGKLDDELKQYGFVRVHESHLVNPDCVAKYNEEVKRLLMYNGFELDVSEQHRFRINLLFPKLKAPARLVFIVAFMGQVCDFGAMVCNMG